VIIDQIISLWVMFNRFNKCPLLSLSLLFNCHFLLFLSCRYISVYNSSVRQQLRSVWPKPSGYETVFFRMVKNPSHLSRRSTIPLLGGCKVDRIPRNLSSKTTGSWKEQTLSV